MDKETFEKQKAFAGEKKTSMLRRCVGHDYTGRQIYMITMVTEGRRPLFGELCGRSDGETGTPEASGIKLSALGMCVEKEWWGIPHYYPQIEILAIQMMPDHFHGILFVKEQMEKDLSTVMRGFKTGCNRAYRELVLGLSPVQYVATQSQQTEQARKRDDRQQGLLFARGFNDKLLLQEGQLERWQQYLADNPRRLLMKREHPDLFRVQRGLNVAGYSFSAIGNRFLLDRPVLVQVQCSRGLTQAEIDRKTRECLTLARQGAVMVSPSISPGEKAVMGAVYKEGLPIIYLQENGLTDLAKPGGKRMEACSRGQLLILAPWEHHNERTTIKRGQCLNLNDMAKTICNYQFINNIQPS
jgi:REP element-mobilizing transposase RayT